MNDSPDLNVGRRSTPQLSTESTVTASLLDSSVWWDPVERTNFGVLTVSLKPSKYLAPILTSHPVGSSLLVGRGGGAGTAYAEGAVVECSGQRDVHPMGRTKDFASRTLSCRIGKLVDCGSERLRWH